MQCFRKNHEIQAFPQNLMDMRTNTIYGITMTLVPLLDTVLNIVLQLLYAQLSLEEVTQIWTGVKIMEIICK